MADEQLIDGLPINWGPVRSDPPLVVVESPYGSPDKAVIAHNERYARACLADSFARGEYPIASHLLYTQPGVLRDDVPDERKLGIAAGLAWARLAAKTVVYGDLGLSGGMQAGIAHAEAHGRPVEHRLLGPAWWGLADEPPGLVEIPKPLHMPDGYWDWLAEQEG